MYETPGVEIVSQEDIDHRRWDIDLTTIARQLARHDRFEWIDGMMILPDMQRHHSKRRCRLDGKYPDLTDPPTVGCLLKIVLDSTTEGTELVFRAIAGSKIDYAGYELADFMLQKWDGETD